MRRIAEAAGLGLVAGFLGGLFGIGGGLVMVPGLVLWMGMDQHRAHGTSVAAIVGAATASVIPFAARGEVDWMSAVWILCGSMVGAYTGARLVTRIPAVWLARAFVTLTVVAAIRMGLES